MKTLFFRFTDQKTFEATLPAGFAYYGEAASPLPDGVTAISIIGTYYTLDGVAAPGFHVNALGTTPKAWAQYQIFPTSPGRIFGDDKQEFFEMTSSLSALVGK